MGQCVCADHPTFHSTKSLIENHSTAFHKKVLKLIHKESRKHKHLPNSSSVQQLFQYITNEVNEGETDGQMWRGFNSLSLSLMMSVMEQEMKMTRVWSPTAHEGCFQMHRVSDQDALLNRGRHPNPGPWRHTRWDYRLGCALQQRAGPEPAAVTSQMLGCTSKLGRNASPWRHARVFVIPAGCCSSECRRLIGGITLEIFSARRQKEFLSLRACWWTH